MNSIGLGKKRKKKKERLTGTGLPMTHTALIPVNGTANSFERQDNNNLRKRTDEHRYSINNTNLSELVESRFEKTPSSCTSEEKEIR